MDQSLIAYQISPSDKRNREIFSVFVVADNYFETSKQPDPRNLELLILFLLTRLKDKKNKKDERNCPRKTRQAGNQKSEIRNQKLRPAGTTWAKGDEAFHKWLFCAPG